VLGEIAPAVTNEKLVVSIAAGIPLETLAGALPQGTRLVRTMPNTPAIARASATAISGSERATTADLDVARALFDAVGKTVTLDESHLDAVTGLSGSGPAYVMLFIEALADGGVRMGLRRDLAIQIAAQMFQGAARMVLETGVHPAALKDQVTTPAGSTIACLLTMEDGRIRSVIARAVEEAAGVAAKLGQS